MTQFNQLEESVRRINSTEWDQSKKFILTELDRLAHEYENYFEYNKSWADTAQVFEARCDEIIVYFYQQADEASRKFDACTNN